MQVPPPPPGEQTLPNPAVWRGYPPPGRPQPFGAPVRPRADAVASAFAGLLALLAAGLLAWFAVANIAAHDVPAPWPSVVRMNVFGGFGAAGLLSIAAVVTFARTVAGAWVLSTTSLFFVIMIMITPLVRGESFSAQLDFVFGFHKTTGVAIGLATIACALTAVVAAVAAVLKRPVGIR